MINLIPHQSEKGLLAGILLGRVELASVIKRIPDITYFSNLECQEIYGFMLTLTAGKTPDLITVTEGLRDKVSAGYISELTLLLDELNFGPDLFTTLMGNIVEAWAARTLDKGIKSGRSAQDVVSEIAAAYTTGVGKYVNQKDLASLLIDSLWEVEIQGRVHFPFKKLDVAAKGMRPGEMIIVAGRTAVGKSSFLENVGTFNALEGKKVLLAIAEQSVDSIGRRIVSRLTGIPVNNRKPEESERPAIDEALNKIATSGLSIYDQGGMRISELEEQLKRERWDLVCLDYLQLIEPSKKYRSQYERVTYASNEIKSLAVKYGVPFLVAAQFNRQAEGEQPNLAQLKDSGALEQDADMVISLWVKGDDEIVGGQRPVYVDLLKNRNGWCLINTDNEIHRLWFNGAKTEFVDEEHRYE